MFARLAYVGTREISVNYTSKLLWILIASSYKIYSDILLKLNDTFAKYKTIAIYESFRGLIRSSSRLCSGSFCNGIVIPFPF